MKIKVREVHITAGRDYATDICGCPVHLAICEALDLPSEFVRIPTVKIARIGKLELTLPRKAILFQLALMKNSEADVAPFEFDLGEKV